MTNEMKYGILGSLPGASVPGHRQSVDSFFKESACETVFQKDGNEFVVLGQS